ncbi:MAG: SRPBCC family protein [Bacteroidota bacterium]
MAKLQKRDLSFLNQAPLKLEKTFQLPYSPKEFWEILIDNEGWTQWFEGMTYCQSLDSVKGGVGSKRAVHLDNMKVVEEFIVWEPEQKWGFTAIEMNIPVLNSLVELIEIQKEVGYSSVTWRVGAQLKWWASPAKGKLYKDLDKAFEVSIGRLKAWNTESMNKKNM